MQQKRQSQDMECDRHNFCHFRSFFAILPHFWPWKLKLGKNVKKHLEILSFCTCIPLIKILWYMVLRYEVQQTGFFCHLGQFFGLLSPKQPKKWKYPKWKKLLETSSLYTSVPKTMIIHYTVPQIWPVKDVIVIFILGCTFPFYPPNSPPKIKISIKW